ncbi:MAG TPA: acetyl-CoA carboxylase carboxyltransferase subunit alpha [Candidatus Intestinimonas stercoravium]|uniref:acetyl-CoA carboxylase carboxyltransferase subunit alpha n=1 Tax=uncultured Intestinimonas sp. TaxID=1689265 RepID=UPI001FA3F31C|nr:acetyl-CoA carboxylase carboxyltransferase subunit alpha [uncultured Intestinimonas sp.]HJA62803.1 acetyl-CoA carboxylase carboxyltransferase subunit alpha [Candidatus Intestinimonas stercoravium]
MAEYTPAERVKIARHADRPGTEDYISALFTDFFEQRGDRRCREDKSILGGVALYKGHPVTVLGHRKGKGLEGHMACNFGMPGPEGYRKAQRIMRQAEKFGRPVITFIDTPGAYPGMEAEARGQGEAIASTLALMSTIDVPVITVVIGEGGSGGALALAVANRVLMLENAVYSVLSPEGFASILWKDASRSDEAAAVMKLTARDLVDLGAADEVIPEPAGGAHENPNAAFVAVDRALSRNLLQVIRKGDYAAQRYEKYRGMGLSRSRKEGP